MSLIDNDLIAESADDEITNPDLIGTMLGELSDCREDERNAQNMIVQVISTAGGIIGVLTGASFFAKDVEIDNATLNALGMGPMLFILSGLILCCAFLYIFTVGITSTLRFHYMRKLEDRISRLAPTEVQMEPFVNWMSFSAPVLTRNPKHIKSLFTRIHYYSYTGAALCAIGFGIAMCSVLFSQIEKHTVVDIGFAVLFLAVMGISGMVYVIACVKAEDMYKYAMKISLEKRHIRMAMKGQEDAGMTEEAKKERRKEILKAVAYYIYPRIVDLQKPLLIVFGFFFGMFLRNGALCLPDGKAWIDLLIAVGVVDFLVYQARYLWNDIRGLKSDCAAGKTDRLPVRLLGDKLAVDIALALMLLRLVLAVILLLFCAGDMCKPLMWLSVLVFVIALVYEKVSEYDLPMGVYAVVSLGYPLRMLAGIAAAWPQFGREVIRFGSADIKTYHLTLIVLAVGMLGSFSAILAWAHKGVDQLKNGRSLHKGYYKPLMKRLENRLGAEYPLKEKGMLGDHWNVAFLIAMGSLALVPCMIAFGGSGLWIILGFELIALALSVKYCTAQHNQIELYLVMLAVVLAGKMIWGWRNLDWYLFSAAIAVLQAAVAGVYYFLRVKFDVNFSFPVMCRNILNGVIVLILGKETAEYLEEKKGSQ